jgi:hypothetical protein
MLYATPDSNAVRAGSERLEQVITALEHGGESKLVTEHLHGAHTYLLGAMPAEYCASLEDARDASKLVADPSARETVQKLVDDLLKEVSTRQDRDES